MTAPSTTGAPQQAPGAPAASRPTAAAERPGGGLDVRQVLGRVPPVWWAFLGLLLVSVVAIRSSGDVLLSSTNVQSVAVATTALGLVALGQTVAMLVGSFDLSVAWTVSLGAVVTAAVMDGRGSMVVPAVLAALAAGAVVGVVNGLVVTKLGVNALIATLATSLLLNGLLNSAVETRAGGVSEGFRELGYGQVGPLPLSFLVVALLAVGLAVVLRSTTFGHHVYAVGGSVDVARVSGIRSDRVVLAAHVICGVFAAAAGVYLASRLGSPDAGLGPRGGYDLESIAVVVLGGTVLGGGRGTVAGTAGGVAIFALLETAFDVLGVDPFLKTVLEGVIIVAAVASHTLRRVRS